MTLRALARGSLLVTVANLVPRAGAFLLLPIYARFLGQADFGTVSLAGSAALLLAIAYRLGLDASLLRMHGDDSGPGRRQLYATTAALTLVAAAAGTLLGAVASVALGPRVDDDLLPLLLVTLAIGAANAFQFVPSVWFRATDRMGRYLGLALGAFMAVVVVTVALVVVMRLGALGSLLGQLAGATVMAGAAAVILWRQRPWAYRSDIARRSLAFGLPLLPHTLAGWLLNLSDRWLLGLFLGLTAAQTLAAIGVYSLGYQLGYAISLIAVSFNAAWMPFLYAIGDGPAGPRVIREAMTIVVTAFFALAACLSILAPDLIGLIAPPEWAAAADVTVIVAFAAAVNAAALMFASGLYLARSTGRLPLVTAAAAIVSVALNVVLIPRLGIIGAAVSTLVAYAVLAAGTWWLASQRHPLRLDWGRLTLAVTVAILALATSRVAAAGTGAGPLAAHLALVIAVVVAGWMIARAPLATLRGALAEAEAAGRPEAASGGSARMAAPEEIE